MNENENAVRSIPLGTHLLHIQGDTLELIARGTLTYGDLKDLLDHFVYIKRKYGMLFVIYNGTECTGFDPAAYKLGSHLRNDDADANLRVAFGVPFAIRVILNMINRAQRVLTNRDIQVPLFDHEKDARAFFEKEREKLRRELSVKK